MRLPSHATSRPGLSLMEVLVALTIFLFSLIALSALVSLATDQAKDIQQRNLAGRLCESNLRFQISGFEMPGFVQFRNFTREDRSPMFRGSCGVLKGKSS